MFIFNSIQKKKAMNGDKFNKKYSSLVSQKLKHIAKRIKEDLKERSFCRYGEVCHIHSLEYSIFT